VDRAKARLVELVRHDIRTEALLDAVGCCEPWQGARRGARSAIAKCIFPVHRFGYAVNM